jgi:hypothetical protein
VWRWRWSGQISVRSERWAPTTKENLHLQPIAAPVMAGAKTAMLRGWPATSRRAKYTEKARQRHQAPCRLKARLPSSKPPTFIDPGPKHYAHINTRYKERYSVRSTSNGGVGQVPALGRALINMPKIFWACRPTHGSKQIIRVPSVRPCKYFLGGVHFPIEARERSGRQYAA